MKPSGRRISVGVTPNLVTTIPQRELNILFDGEKSNDFIKKERVRNHKKAKIEKGKKCPWCGHYTHSTEQYHPDCLDIKNKLEEPK